MKDCKVGSLEYFYFTTAVNGVAATLSSSPAIAVYRAGSSTASTTVAALTVDVNSVTGFNRVAIDFTGDSGFYSAGQDFAIITSSGTVGGFSVAGTVVETFTIEKSPVNWAQVTAPTTTVTFSNTTILGATATLSANLLQWRGSTPNALVSNRVDANVADSTLAAEAYAADGAEPTLSQMLYMLWSTFAQFDIAATTITTRKLDGTTQAMTFQMDNTADQATSRVRNA